jgi:hypothetical protein
MTLVTVYRALNPADAQVVRSRLEASEFTVFVNHEIVTTSIEGYALTAGGIVVQVPEDQAVEARELITSTEPPSEFNEEKIPPA